MMNVVIPNLEDVEKMKATVTMMVTANLVLFVLIITVTLVVSLQQLIVVLEKEVVIIFLGGLVNKNQN